MRDKLRIWMWKTCIAVLGILLIWQIGNLLTNLAVEEEEVPHFVATNTSLPTNAPMETMQPTPTPFVLTNFDIIRVVITNKETGSIYHEDISDFQNGADYRGMLQYVETDAGYVVINELPVEEYLYSVVPSEMPASYPMEALKAQAICARTYAYLHMLSPGYPKWDAHVDDTTSFQVYHSVEEQERTTQAVNETEGVILLAPGGQSLAETYYYSTSCGVGSDAHVWRTKYSDNYPYIQSKHINREVAEKEAVAASVQITDAENVTNGMGQGNGETGWVQRMLEDGTFEEYIRNINLSDFEAQESWYRWSYQVKEVDLERMLSTLQKRYEANQKLILTLKGSTYVSQPIKELDKLVDIIIEKRGAGGVADELLIITEKNVYKVITELNIRYVLNDGVTKVLRQDASEVSMPALLPSAFIVLENEYNNGELTGYGVIGGGFGHGAGMSQNAAKAMAQEGMSAQEILTFFFEDCTLGQK